MTGYEPPSKYNGHPHSLVLAAGTVLSRVHRDAYSALSFNPVASGIVFGGGRFDATALDPHPFLYAGEADATAVSEALLRDLEPNDRGARYLAKAVWTGRQLSRVRLTADVRLISLVSAVDLGAVGADSWLVHCDPDDYPKTREWARWLRTVDPTAAGLAWSSKRELNTTSYVLFGDRCPPGLFVPEPGPLHGDCKFDDAPGRDWLRTHLAPYRVSIRR